MEKLRVKHNYMLKALETLHDAILIYETVKNDPSKKIDDEFLHEKTLLTTRDSLIQRFEYCVDLFWKYLKNYLEMHLKVIPQFATPIHIIRTSCDTRLITEGESVKAIDMIRKRNLTSHIYKEEIADMVSESIPQYYELMINIIKNRLSLP